MKVSIFIMLFATLQVSASLYSQQAKLKLEVNEKPLMDVIRTIEKQSNYRFFFSDNYQELYEPVSITSAEASLDEVLASLLNNKSITYQLLENDIVVITPINNRQQTKVTGTVRDLSTGELLIGVNILIEGTSVGTITDLNGKFSIEVSQPDAVLVFSYVGYLPEKVTYSGQTTLDIDLSPDITSLEEIVVVAFGTQKKVNLTGSVGSVDAEALESRPIQSTVQALQGVIPGLNITAAGTGGELNASKSINIRGTGTIGAGSKGDPLVLIDGMEGDLNALNPQDIENISVLKDAASSSIYGSRAPFGVILITTKRGKEGRTVVNYNNNFRWNSPVLLPDMMDSYQFVNYYNDAAVNGGGGAIFNEHVVERVLQYQQGILDPTDVVELGSGGKWNYDYTNGDVDWYSEYYREWAPAQEHAISVSGGNERMSYYASGNYLDQEGLMRYGTDLFDRYSLTAKITGKLSKCVTMDYSARFIRSDYSRPTYMSEGFYDNVARRARPIRPKYDPNGFLMSDVNYIDAMGNGGRREDQQDWLYQQIRTTITPLKDWNITGEFNYRTYTDFIHEVGFMAYAYFADGINKYRATTSIQNEYVYEKSFKSNFFNPNVYTDYSKSFQNHNFKVLLGFQSELNKYRDLEASRNDLITHEVPVIGQTISASPSLKGQYQNWATSGFFGRMNYDYDGKYLLEFNLRYDGTSRYRENLRWNWFPSVSAGWNVAREEFWKLKLGKIETFKIRGSYGELGNQNTESWYPTYSTIPTEIAKGNWIVGNARPNTSGAPGLISTSLSWETIRTWNIGLDLGALQNRLTLVFDVFTRYTDDMVGPAPSLPDVLGTKEPKMNNTNLETKGFELILGWRDNLDNGFSYGVNVTLADSRTKITKYPNEIGKIEGTNETNPNNKKYQSGYYINEIWGYTTLGIAQSDAEMQEHLAALTDGGQNALGSNWTEGDIMYKDSNGDHKISEGARTIYDHGDLEIIGNSTPRYMMGINLDAAWKGIDFGMFWQGVLKRDYYPTGMTFWGCTGSGQWWSTAFTEHLDYYRPEGHVLGANQNSYYPRPIFGGKNQHAQTGYLQNAAYMRLKNLQLGYTLPMHITNKLKLQKVRIFVSGENLITITRLSKTLDPESVGIGKQGGTVYPLSKVYAAGISVNF